MKISILTASISRKAGGVLDAVRRLAGAVAAHGPARVEVLGLEDEHTEADRPLWRPLEPRTFPVSGPRSFGYAPSLPGSLDALRPDPPQGSMGGAPPWQGHWGEDCRVLLFLGRLHPKKGLPNLVRAWQQLRTQQPGQVKPWRLAVLGWDQGGHAEELTDQIRGAGLE